MEFGAMGLSKSAISPSLPVFTLPSTDALHPGREAPTHATEATKNAEKRAGLTDEASHPASPLGKLSGQDRASLISPCKRARARSDASSSGVEDRRRVCRCGT